MTFTLITPGRPAIVCGKDLIHIRVDPFQFNHQVLVAGGVNEAILNTVKTPVFIRVKNNILRIWKDAVVLSTANRSEN